MRCGSREIKDQAKVFEVLARCETVRVGMFAGRYPYVVPVSFGMEVVEGKAHVYFHSAKVGDKAELLRKNPNVCIEADRFICYELLKRGIDTRYESVIGFGTCEEVEGEEKLKGLRLLTQHCGYDGHPVDVCLGLPITSVFKITVESMTGKRTLPNSWSQATPSE